MFIRASLPKAKRIVQYGRGFDAEKPRAAACGFARAAGGPREAASGNREAFPMQLPDEAITYQYQGALIPQSEDWTPAAELRSRHFLPAAKLRDLSQRITQMRSEVAIERDLKQVPPEKQPLDAGFIDLPQKLLDQHRRQA